MKGGSTQLKPQRLQQLYEYDSDDLALPMFPNTAPKAAAKAPRFATRRSTQKMSVITEVKDIADDTIKSVESNTQQEVALEATVKAQGEMIDKLEAMMEKQLKAEAAQPKASPAKKAAAPAKKAAAPKAAPRKAPAQKQRQAVPTLGSWDMAKAAGGDFGTNVVHLYADLRKKGNHVEVDNRYHSGNAQAEQARGEPDFSGDREEDTDYWDEDEHSPAANSLDAAADADDAHDMAKRAMKNKVAAPTVSIDAAADADDVDDQKARDDFAAQGVAAPDAIDAAADQDDKLDSKPPLTSWDMAKFANNVEAGGGTMGTNIAYMYDNLANKGLYRKVEGESPLDNDHYEEDFDEYKGKNAKNQVLKQRFGIKNKQHHIGPHGVKKFAQGSV